MSPKRDNKEIGRFGLGFKSVLGICKTPQFFSLNGSFRFDPALPTADTQRRKSCGTFPLPSASLNQLIRMNILPRTPNLPN